MRVPRNSPRYKAAIFRTNKVREEREMLEISGELSRINKFRAATGSSEIAPGGTQEQTLMPAPGKKRKIPQFGIFGRKWY